jgi:hypothetical protein
MLLIFAPAPWIDIAGTLLTYPLVEPALPMYMTMLVEKLSK